MHPEVKEMLTVKQKEGRKHTHTHTCACAHIYSHTYCAHTHAREQFHSLARGCMLPPLYSQFLACFTETHPLCFVGQDTHTGRERGVCNSVTVRTHERQELPFEATAGDWCVMGQSNNRGGKYSSDETDAFIVAEF